ncbi:MAG: adenylate kinase family protein [Promethearchaeota archaeon]
MKIVIVSGTPGTGKTSVSMKISKKIGSKVISLNELVVQKKFTLKYDNKRNTYVIDLKRLNKYILEKLHELKQENEDVLIIEGHFADIIHDKYIDYAIVLRCDPNELYHRLKKRGYTTEKIKENVQSEILGSCINFFNQKQLKNMLIEIDTTDKSIETVANIIINIFTERESLDKYKVGKVDWLEKIFREDSINKYFNNF